MTNSHVLLSPFDLGIAAILIVVAGGLSLILSMGIHKSLYIAATRMIIQLLLVGYILGFVFTHSSPALVILVILVMMGAASYEIGARQQNKKSRHYGMNFLVLTTSTVGVGAIGLISLMMTGSENVTNAQHIIPMFGIILGSAMNSTALTLNAYSRQITQRYQTIETRLALGATFRQATSDISRSSAVSGSIPLVNQMAGAGLITLPGIMSGQLLVGQSPVQAAFYQIFLMSLLLLVSVICVVMAITLVSRSMTDSRQRLRLDRIIDME